MNQPYIIAISGGSCSGKTSLAREIQASLGEQTCSLLLQDNYYFGKSCGNNFDIPEAIEHTLLIEQLQALKNGAQVQSPVYDFSLHQRAERRDTVVPTKFIVVDGILILHWPELRDCFDLAIFVECDEEVRRERRLERDFNERGRTKAEALAQFEQQVAPLHRQYVEPTKAFADLVLSSQEINDWRESIDTILGYYPI